jgi:hypothetical protein
MSQTTETSRPGAIAFVPIPYDVFTDPSLTPMEKLAIGRLTLYAGKDGRCYPSHETLASEFGIDRRNVVALLHSLRKKGRLAWKRTGKSNAYTLVRCGSDVTETSHQDVTETSHQMCREQHIRCDAGITEKEVLKEQGKEKASVLPPQHCSTEKKTPALLPWTEETKLIAEAIRPHAEAIGRVIDEDPNLCHYLADLANQTFPAPYGARAAASLISKTIMQRFHPEFIPSNRLQPWPASLGFWITVVKEDIGKDVDERARIRCGKHVRPAAAPDCPKDKAPESDRKRTGGGLVRVGSLGSMLEKFGIGNAA